MSELELVLLDEEGPQTVLVPADDGEILVPLSGGLKGDDGDPGPSAYDVAVKQGFEGTVEEWLASLVGPEGEGRNLEFSWDGTRLGVRVEGDTDFTFVDLAGASGQSAYELAVDLGFEGSEAQWLASLAGPAGLSAYEVAVGEGFEGSEIDWLTSLTGMPGISAYEEWLDLGNEGTPADFVESLKGATGGPGLSTFEVWLAAGNSGTVADFLNSLQGASGGPGLSAYEVAVGEGFEGTVGDWLTSLIGKPGGDGDDGNDGDDGDSAYQIAVKNGFTGSEADWLASLKGERGGPGEGVPTGGTPGQVLAKAAADDFATEWVDVAAGGADLPPVGAEGDVLTTVNGEWVAATPSGGADIPPGDSAGDVLTWDGQEWVGVAPQSGLPQRQVAVLTTASLPSKGREVGLLELAPAYRLLRIEVDKPARVRFYTSVAKRNQDVDRPIGEKPTGDNGRLFEFISTVELPNADLSPVVDGFVADGSSGVPYTVDLQGVSSGVVNVSLIWVRTE